MSFECTATSPAEHVVCEAIELAAAAEPAAASGILRNFFQRLLGATWTEIQALVASGNFDPASILAALAAMALPVPAWLSVLLPMIVNIIRQSVKPAPAPAPAV